MSAALMLAVEPQTMAELGFTAVHDWREHLRPFRTAWTLVLIAILLVAIFDLSQLQDVVLFALNAFIGTLPYIATAVFLIAYLKSAGAESLILNAFAGRESRMIVLSALIGGLAPFCSCEVIPFIAGLLALGAPLSAVMAFWLSSPLIDPPSLFITAGALGWEFAIGKTVAAVALGMLGGFTIRLLVALRGLSNPLRADIATKTGGCGGSGITGKPVWRFWADSTRRALFKKEFVTNAKFLIKWLAVAYTLEAILVTYVPAKIVAEVVGGDGVSAIVVAAIVGMPAYLNGYVAPPLVAGLVEQGMSIGSAMAFMVAGAVSSIPAMVAVWSLVKPKIFALYLSLGVLGAVFAGLMYQWVA